MAKEVRVCHVVGDSAFGGGSQVIMALVKSSLMHGCSVSVVATDPVFCRHLRETGAEVVELDCIWRSVRPLRDLRGLERLRRHFLAAEYDLVHTHTSKAGVVGRIAARLAGVPAVIHTVHGFSFHEATPPGIRHAHVALEKLAGFCCDRIVTVSEFHRDWAVRLGIAPAAKIVAIPNGVADIERIDGPTRERVRSELGFDAEHILVFSASRLTRGKGLEHLVETGSRLRKAGRSDIRILIAGTGDQEADLHEMVRQLACSDSVELIGFRTDVARLLGAADIVTLPSQREGLSIALLEALAAGRAVVASTIGSNLEAADGVAEFVEYGDVDGLESTLLELAADPDRRDELGRSARTRYEERYAERHMVEAYAALYAEVGVDAR